MKRFLIAGLVVALLVCAAPAMAATYLDQTLTGGYQKGHFNDVWDLTAGDMTIAFTYDATGMQDDADAHAWSELGVRSLGSKGVDFNPYLRTTYSTTTVNLLAGQHTDVGDVIVQRVGDLLYVTYRTVDGWAMTETHLAVASSSKGIPQTKKGNPIPGQFPNKAYHNPPVTEYTYMISSVDWTKPVVIAAHAAVVHITEGCIDLASDESTMVTAGNEGVGVPYPKPAVEVSGPWTGLTHTFSSSTGWIWEAYPVIDPVNGNIVEFKKSFTIPGMYFLEKSGELYITCDNGYEIKVNDASLGKAQLADNFRSAPRTNEIVWWYDTLSLPPTCGGGPYGWQTVEQYDIGNALAIGSNSLSITGVNEADTADECPDGEGTSTSNPAGLIYEGEVCYKVVDQEETAWAAGTRFPGAANWATYFSYTAGSGTQEAGSGVWLATDYDGTVNTFDPDPVGFPTLDLDDKLILQRQGGYGEGDYNLPSVPIAPGNNHRFWWDRDGVDPWQNPATANTGGIYQIIIKLHATGATTGTAYMNIRGLDQGFETDGNWNTIELTPAGMTFTGDMKHLQVFYGIYGYGATHTAKFQNIQVTQ